MLNFAIRRIILVIFVALTVSVIAFFLVRMSGDLATSLAGEDANAQEIADIREIYGLNRPLVVQYGDWLFKALKGDFGESLYFPESVGELVGMRLPTTLLLAFSGLAISLIIGIPFGVISALKPNSWVDRVSMSIAVAGQAIPTSGWA
jgi:peptide/nickel transport system permease protein